jgi:hypothetical protein
MRLWPAPKQPYERSKGLLTHQQVVFNLTGEQEYISRKKKLGSLANPGYGTFRREDHVDPIIRLTNPRLPDSSTNKFKPISFGENSERKKFQNSSQYFTVPRVSSQPENGYEPVALSDHSLDDKNESILTTLRGTSSSETVRPSYSQPVHASSSQPASGVLSFNSLISPPSDSPESSRPSESSVITSDSGSEDATCCFSRRLRKRVDRYVKANGFWKRKGLIVIKGVKKSNCCGDTSSSSTSDSDRSDSNRSGSDTSGSFITQINYGRNRPDNGDIPNNSDGGISLVDGDFPNNSDETDDSDGGIALVDKNGRPTWPMVDTYVTPRE